MFVCTYVCLFVCLYTCMKGIGIYVHAKKCLQVVCILSLGNRYTCEDRDYRRYS